MLETIGVESLDQLINETIPADIRLKNLWIGAWLNTNLQITSDY
jgi:glycine cleavage system pyridoxal-binding protein P